MKNVIVANFQPDHEPYVFERLETLIRAQIENSLQLGWAKKDIVLLTNFDYEFMEVNAKPLSLNDLCLTGSKMFAVRELLKDRFVNDELWVHDLDAWQNTWFDCPKFRDVGICEYSQPKFNGGSVFYKPSARDIVETIVSILKVSKETKEEPTIDRVLKTDEYRHRVTVLNPTYNVGCSGFEERYARSQQPILVCHFHPHNRIAVERHLLDRDGLGITTVTSRLEQILRKYFTMATKLSDEGKRTRKERIRLRQSRNVG